MFVKYWKSPGNIAARKNFIFFNIFILLYKIPSYINLSTMTIWPIVTPKFQKRRLQKLLPGTERTQQSEKPSRHIAKFKLEKRMAKISFCFLQKSSGITSTPFHCQIRPLLFRCRLLSDDIFNGISVFGVAASKVSAKKFGQ